MFSIPTKYPLNTEAIETNNTAGDNTIRVYFTPGFANIFVDTQLDEKNNNNAKPHAVPTWGFAITKKGER